MFGERILLRKVKTMRNTFSEKNAEQFPEGTCLQTVSVFFLWLKYNYSPPEEHHECECFGRMVLHRAPWCSSLALGLIWRCHVGCWSWGSCQEAETLGQRGPTQRRRHYHPQLLSWWLGPEIIRWQVNIHSCVKDVSLVWGRLFLLSRRQWQPTSVLLPGKTQGWRGLVGCSPRDH